MVGAVSMGKAVAEIFRDFPRFSEIFRNGGWIFRNGRLDIPEWASGYSGMTFRDFGLAFRDFSEWRSGMTFRNSGMPFRDWRAPFRDWGVPFRNEERGSGIFRDEVPSWALLKRESRLGRIRGLTQTLVWAPGGGHNPLMGARCLNCRLKNPRAPRILQEPNFHE